MKRNRLIFSLVCSLVVGAFAACGGVDSDLLGGSSDGGSSTDGSIKNDGSTRDGSTSRDSGNKSDGGSIGDDASPPADGGIVVHPKKDAGILACGTNGSSGGLGGTPVSCTSGDPVCCATQYPFDTVNPVSFGCTANEFSCSDFDSGAIPIECRANEDCPGAAQCCGHQTTYDTTGTPITIYDAVHCAVACPLFTVDGGSTPNRLFCNPAGANTCPSGETCTQSTLLPGFYVCG